MKHDFPELEEIDEIEDARYAVETCDDGSDNFQSIGQVAGAALRALFIAWRTESPIEALLGTQLADRVLAADGQVFYQHELIAGAMDAEDPAKLVLQSQRGGYRVDFELTRPRGATCRSLIIECDGFDFHERTAEQATKDRRRDRHFLMIGVPTLRFTGSEITRDASACADEVLAYWGAFYAAQNAA